MSRVGRKPILVPANVQLELAGQRLKVKGRLGELEHVVPAELEAQYLADSRQLCLRRRSESRHARALHGLHRSLIANKITGVSEGFMKRMEIYGTGYSVDVRGQSLVLQVGFSNQVVLPIPPGITVEVEERSGQVERPARFVIRGYDKELVGQFAARVRHVRPPEPYKGKGIRYEGEYVRRKEGKAFTGLGA